MIKEKDDKEIKEKKILEKLYKKYKRLMKEKEVLERECLISEILYLDIGINSIGGKK